MEHLPGRKDIKLIIADSDLKPITVVRNWTSIESDLTQNTAGSGQFAAPVSERLVSLVDTPGNRVHLYHKGNYFCGGPIEVRTQDEPAKSDGVKTVNWTTDLVALAGRLVAPNPAKGLFEQDLVNYITSGVAETVLRDLVNKNAGPGAITTRRVPHLVLGTANSPLVGSSVSVQSPLSTKLADQLRDLASAGGSLTFDIVLQDNAGTPQLAFVVWAPADVSSVVRYSKGLGNLNGVTFTNSAPTVTVAVVGQDSAEDSSGNPVPGEVIERSDSTVVGNWGRVEQWVSSTADTSLTDHSLILAQMQQDGDLALLSGSESVEIDADVFDTPKRQYGVNYRLGDIVGIQPATGAPIKDTVTAVKLTADPKSGATIAPTIGTGDARNGKALIDYVLQLQRRIARLEAGR